ncbi:helix-turn-helix domain protein [Desulfosporosinus acididurans]|uniref:Helix-turn-helix domain protein n=1 Tax=Desulfosporosinus acididurans TaxID=476652 RepID=A0A0J1FQX3_9FIRM|nr:helix-turn-helix transcriptional regulator [Desulfosporosinus acididurans]KLU65692.1 helix-turn-helix domain protein [Desulfosporosinus acididurans]
MEDEKHQQLIRQYDTGQYLLSLRTEKGLTQPVVGKALGISSSYLSEIEKGVRMPSDELIEEFANYYGVNDNDLFQRYGKIPVIVRQEMREHPYLQDTLAELRRLRKKGKITDEQSDKLLREITTVYKKHIEEIRGEE